MSEVKAKKPMVTDIFVEGAKKGWVIATTSTLPNVLMAFVIIKALQITGALDLMAVCSLLLWLCLVCRVKPLQYLSELGCLWGAL